MSQTPETSALAGGRLRLAVKTADSQSEIVVLDSRGRFVERGFGPEHAFELERGIYRVKVLTGAESQEKTVVLTEQPRELQFAQSRFASPVPLLSTSTSHEYHTNAAVTQSLKTHVADGAGSSLFFLVRDWTPYNASKPARVTGNPATGLSLYATTPGERLVCNLAESGVSSMDNDPWFACTIDVAPGVYELRLELPWGGTLRQSFVASPHWQTQAFSFMRGYQSVGATASAPMAEWRADLSRTSVVLSPGKGFSPNEPRLRLAELARVALATKRPSERGEQHRRLLPDEVRALLRGKWDNPMLGIYAGHLLLMETTVDVSLFAEVVHNLRKFIGDRHPDVEALALRADSEQRPQPFEDPPMLRRSWSLIVDASVADPGLVTGALAARSTGGLWSEGPWHILRSSALVESDEPGTLVLSDLEAALAEDLGVMKYIRRLKNDRSRSDLESIPGATQLGGIPPPTTSTSPSMGQPGIALGTTPAATYHPGQSTIERSDTGQTELTLEIDRDQVRSIARRFGLPSNQLRQVLSRLEDKMGRTADVPNLKVVLKL